MDIEIDRGQGGYLNNRNNIIQQHLRSHNATSAEEGRAIDSSYLAFARTITRRARVRQ